MTGKQKRIYLTVDTECHKIENLNKTIYGETKQGKVYGIEKILQLGQELDIPVNVFLDIPECHRYGYEHTQKIVNLINKYNQPIFLHVHPDYIGDPERKHLWEYTESEQKQILKTAIDDYFRFCGHKNKIVFRAGAWGVNSSTYKVLRELLPESEYEVLDLSFVYNSNRRCHLTYEEYGLKNASKTYEGIKLLPNTTYIGFDLFNKQITASLNVPNPNLDAFNRVIKKNELHSITYTMHSWDFIKRWFFLPNHISGDRYIIWKFKRSVKCAKKNGYTFANLNDFEMVNEQDQCVNLCETFLGKVLGMWDTYLTYASIGRSYKKYAFLYFLPTIILIAILIMLILK